MPDDNATNNHFSSFQATSNPGHGVTDSPTTYPSPAALTPTPTPQPPNHRKSRSHTRTPSEIPAELRGDFAPGVWEPTHEKRRAHNRNASLALPSSPSSDENDRTPRPRKGGGGGGGTPVTATSGSHHQSHGSSISKKRGPPAPQHQHQHEPRKKTQTQPAQPHPPPPPQPVQDTSRRRTTVNSNSVSSATNPYAMAGPSDKKRVKGAKITRAFRIGSEAWKLGKTNRPPGIPDDHTTGWRVYVENIDGGPDMSLWLNKVQFSLHETYPNAKRMISAPPFEVRETGWGGFTVEIRLYFQPYVGEKHAVRSHYLYLEPYGSSEQMERQKSANLVKAEILDFVEFNEPTEALYAALTDDERQWDSSNNNASTSQAGGAGKGRGKGPAQTGGVPPQQRTVELPERGSERNPYSKQMEESLLRLIKGAENDVDKQIEEMLKKRERLEARKKDLASTGDLEVGKKKK